MTTSTDTFLTQEAYYRLQAELAELQGPRRQDIIDRIEAAREEGDLKENGGYHAAKDEQGKMELRIKVLIELLRNAQVGEVSNDSGIAGPGMVVTVRFDGDSDTESFLVGSREAAGSSDIEVYSPQSKIGEAVTGHKAGETVTYSTPAGKTMSLEIVEVTAHHG